MLVIGSSPHVGLVSGATTHPNESDDASSEHLTRTRTLEPTTTAGNADAMSAAKEEPGGLHPPVRAALLPAVGHRRRRHLRAGRHRLPRRLRHRRQHRHRARHHQRPLGHPDRRGDHLRHRVPAGLLRGPVQHRPRPDHPRLRLRLLRVGADERHLRDVHLHLLRARGLDHGPGPGTRARHSRCGSATRCPR